MNSPCRAFSNKYGARVMFSIPPATTTLASPTAMACAAMITVFILDPQTLLTVVAPTEWGILTSLAAVPGRVYSRYELVNRIRGYEFDGYERTVDSHVKNLRRKLGPTGTALVETVVGVGYRLGWSRDR